MSNPTLSSNLSAFTAWLFGSAAPAPAEEKPGNRRLQMTLMVAAIAVALFLILVRVLLNWDLDDSFITFQYAQSLADGKGFVFTPRYATWGTTTPLFTLLLALFAKMNASIPFSARVIDFFALCLQVAVACRVMQSLSLRSWRPLVIVAIAFLFYRPTSFPSMEYGLYAATCVGALAFIASSQWWPAAICAALAATLRVDGALVWGLTLCAYAFHTRGRNRPVLFGACLVLIPLAWYAFAYSQFGRFTPQTLETRQREALVWGTFGKLWLQQFISIPHKQLVLIPALLGLIAAIRRAPRMLWMLVFFVGYICLYSYFGIPGHFMYFCPLHLIVNIFLCVWIAVVFLHFVSRRRMVILALVLAATLACVAKDVWWSARWWPACIAHPPVSKKYLIYRGIADWLRNDMPPNAAFAANEIGILAFYSKQDLIEIGGLVNPEGLPYVPYRFSTMVRDINPNLIVVPDDFLAVIRKERDGSFLKTYDTLGAFSGEATVLVRKGLWDKETFQSQKAQLRKSVFSVKSLW